MASIIDSFRGVLEDNLSFFKLLIFAIPIYFSIDLYLSGKDDNLLIILFLLTIFLLFGFLIRTTNGVLNEHDTILPPINVFKFAFSATKGLIAIAPSTVIAMAAAYYLGNMINLSPAFDIMVKSILWLLAASISLTSLLMYSRHEKITDAFNFKTISDKSADLLVGLIFFVIQIVIINFPTTILIGYVVTMLFGDGPILYFYIALAVVFNVGVTGHYLAQLQYEVLGYDRENF